MFYSEGYLPLNRIFDDTYSVFFEHSTRDSNDGPLSEKEKQNNRHRNQQSAIIDTSLYVWDFVIECAESNKVHILTQEGNTVFADSTLFTHNDPSKPIGVNIDLRTGTAGSGNGYDWLEKEFTIDDKREVFGPFLYCQIVIKDSAVKKFLRSIKELASGKRIDFNVLTEQIVAAFDQKKPVTKKWVKDNLAQDVKTIEFKAAWNQAAKQRPELSKSGPKGPRIN